MADSEEFDLRQEIIDTYSLTKDSGKMDDRIKVLTLLVKLEPPSASAPETGGLASARKAQARLNQ